MDIKCKCGNGYFYTQERGPHKGLYCLKCNKWVAWVKKDKEQELKRMGKIKPVNTIVNNIVNTVPIIEEGANIDGETARAFMDVESNKNKLGIGETTDEDDVAFEILDEDNGCEICNGGKLKGTYCGGNLQLLKGSYIIHKPDGTINYQFGATVKFCPHCGKEV